MFLNMWMPFISPNALLLINNSVKEEQILVHKMLHISLACLKPDSRTHRECPTVIPTLYIWVTCFSLTAVSALPLTGSWSGKGKNAVRVCGFQGNATYLAAPSAPHRLHRKLLQRLFGISRPTITASECYCPPRMARPSCWSVHSSSFSTLIWSICRVCQTQLNCE